MSDKPNGQDPDPPRIVIIFDSFASTGMKVEINNVTVGQLDAAAAWARRQADLLFGQILHQEAVKRAQQGILVPSMQVPHDIVH